MTADKTKPSKSDKPRRRPGRVPTSCAECRRLKLRCDRNIPCGKCVERGCGSICPDGSLASGRKNRLVLANTEELHDRIESLCARIRDLENGLRDLQSTVTDEPHPLLASHLVQLKSSDFFPPTQTVNGNVAPPPNPTASTSAQPPNPNQPSHSSTHGLSPTSPSTNMSTPPTASTSSPGESNDTDKSDEENFIDAFGTLTLGADGESSFLGKTARSEYLIRALAKPTRNTNRSLPRISARIANLSCGDEAYVDQELVQEVYNMLPSLSEAIRLCEIYLELGKVLWIGMPRDELIDEIVLGTYRTASPASSGYHSLALLFVIFSLGSLFDTNKPAYSVDAQEYYYLSRAAFGFSPTSEAPTLRGIQALTHMAQYKELADWESLGGNTAWTLAGLGVKLAYSIGLHVDSRRWGLPAEVSQKRNTTFWMIFIVDSWTSFQFGRPPSVSLSYADSPLPEETEEIIGPDGPETSFNLWCIKFTRLMHNIMITVYGAKMPSYSTIVGLDKEVRDFPVPHHLRWSCVERPDSTRALQRWFVLYLKETTLLNLHRAYFTQALHEHVQPDDLYKHKYLASVMATYRSAWRLTQSLTDLWAIAPIVLSRLTMAWSQGLAAAIVMCILVTRSPGSKMTEPALAELDQVANLYEEAAHSCRSAGNLAETIQTLRRKAHEAINHTQSPRTSHLSPEELNRLGGGTHLISECFQSAATSPQSVHLSAATSPESQQLQSPVPPGPTVPQHVQQQMNNASPSTIPSASASQHSTPSSQTASPQILQPITPPPLSNHMHPTVVEDMRSLDVGALRASFFDMPSDPYMLQMQQQQQMEAQQQQQQQQQQMGDNMQGMEYTNDPAMYQQQQYAQYANAMGAGEGNVGGGCLPAEQPGNPHDMTPLMQGYGQPPMLDATWHSFVEQLGF